MNDSGTRSLTKIIVNCEREVAYQSPDHLQPWGTKRDSSRNRLFNKRLYQLYKYKDIAVLDLGCSGGGFVKSCIDDGYLAVGLEGSDYSKLHKRAEWATITDFLFTCDITGDFEILKVSDDKKERVLFDVVTTWEVIEHIAEPDLSIVASNVEKHLKKGGLWIMSVSPNEDIINGVQLHQTVQERVWWIRKFEELGFKHLEEYVRYFNTQFVRGPKYNAPGSFHLILCREPSMAPPIPKKKLSDTFLDWWIGSMPQKVIKKLLTGE